MIKRQNLDQKLISTKEEEKNFQGGNYLGLKSSFIVAGSKQVEGEVCKSSALTIDGLLV